MSEGSAAAAEPSRSAGHWSGHLLGHMPGDRVVQRVLAEHMHHHACDEVQLLRGRGVILAGGADDRAGNTRASGGDGRCARRASWHAAVAERERGRACSARAGAPAATPGGAAKAAPACMSRSGSDGKHGAPGQVMTGRIAEVCLSSWLYVCFSSPARAKGRN